MPDKIKYQLKPNIKYDALVDVDLIQELKEFIVSEPNTICCPICHRPVITRSISDVNYFERGSTGFCCLHDGCNASWVICNMGYTIYRYVLAHPN